MINLSGHDIKIKIKRDTKSVKHCREEKVSSGGRQYRCNNGNIKNVVLNH